MEEEAKEVDDDQCQMIRVCPKKDDEPKMDQKSMNLH